MLAPEADGGLGLTIVDLVLVLEETGRYAVPEPIVETAAVGGAARSVATDRRVGRRPSSCRGPTPPTSCSPPTGRFERRDDRARRRVASVDGARRLFEVRGAPRTRRRASTTAYDRGVCRHRRAAVRARPDRMLELTVDYVKERQQFGVPVGSFQAVKHHLAERAASRSSSPARSCTGPPASIATGDPTASRTCRWPRRRPTRPRCAGRAALQCHGAIGYTTEYDLHLYMKRAWALAAAWGDAQLHRDRVGRAIL